MPITVTIMRTTGIIITTVPTGITVTAIMSMATTIISTVAVIITTTTTIRIAK